MQLRRCWSTLPVCNPSDEDNPPAMPDRFVREFPEEYKPGESEPYYPVPGKESQNLAERYRALAAAEPNVTFLGRLATYRYLNMDQVIASALHTADKLLGTVVVSP